MLNKIPNLFEKTIFKELLAKDIYKNFLLPKIKIYSKNNLKKETQLKNILAINTTSGKGGAAKVAKEFLVENLNKQGFCAKILVETDFENNDKNTLKLKQIYPEFHKTLHKASKKLGWLDFFNPSSFEIPKLQEFQNADLVHLHNIHGAYFSLFLLPELTALKPVIWTLHDEQSYTGHCAYAFCCNKWQTGCGNCPDLNFYPKLKKDTTAFLLETKKKIYNHSDFTAVCPSQWLADNAQKSILKDKDIRVIYNGINEKVFAPKDKIEARKLLDLPLDKKILLFSASGSIKNPQKGGEYLLKAYNRFKDNDDYFFVNLGAVKSQNKKNWIDIPYVNDETRLALFYSAADLFIYPSMAESFGLVIAEALACRTPVVAFNNSAIPELVKHMETGYLAENKNVDDFVNGIKTILEDKELQKRIGENGRKLVLEKFTLDRMINEYKNLYNEVFEKFNQVD